jgi:hypothetical protein
MNPRYGVVGAALVAACARGVADDGAGAIYLPPAAEDAGTEHGDDGGSGEAEPSDAAHVDDASPGALDSAADVRPSEDAPTDAPPVGCSVVINEVMTGVTGAASDEFVEVFNPCATAVDVSGYSLVYRAGTSTAPSDTTHDAEVLFTWPAGTSFPSHAWHVYAGTGYGGTKDGPLQSGLKDGSGAIAIRDASGRIVDAVGYGAGTINPSNAFIESSAAPANDVVAAPGQSIARHPDGADSNDNAKDFRAGAPTPRATN